MAHYDVVLARYGEIGIKSRPVRRRFEQTLQENIERAFEAESLDCVVNRIPGRFLITSKDLSRAQDLLVRIFGLTSVSPARIVPSEKGALLESIRTFFDEVAAQKPNAKTFAMRVRRSGQHAYTSQDIARAGGGVVLDRPGGERWKVNLGTPDIEVFVEIRDHQAFLFDTRREGPGGLPVGTQGKVVLMLKDRNSLMAGWLMLKRGCNLVPITFLGPTGAPGRAHELLAVLRKWNFRGPLIEIPHGETSEFPAKEACALCMRQMVRKADHIARRKKAKGIATGESFGSTTVDNLQMYAPLAHVPLLRPLLGMTPHLLDEFARRIGIEPGRNVNFQEPCPYRVRGKVDEAQVVRLEAELGNEPRAFDAIKTRTTTGGVVQ